MTRFIASRMNTEPDNGSGLTFSVFGLVRVWRGGVELDLGSPQQRATLAALVFKRGRMVPVDEIIGVLWGENAPPAARGTVRTYVHRLRRLLGEHVLRSVGTGYQLVADDAAVDLGRFVRAVDAAGEARRAGDISEAERLLELAVAEWRDDVLTGVRGEWADAERQRLRMLGVQALETLAELTLARPGGRSADMIEPLTALALTEPLRERTHELLMIALSRSGRPAEALTVFERIRITLRDELGVDPGPGLRTTHERILNIDPALQAQQVATAPHTLVVPAQLPAALPVFVGRVADLDDLSSRMGAPNASCTVVVHGTAGVGKTTFAVEWANQVVSAYPDGQLYVNLRGFEASDAAREPEEVLRKLLDGLGASPPSGPISIESLAALYRGVLADRRVLVVLDNARDSAQVLPLLPGGTGSAALVTSRVALTSVVAGTGAHVVKLDLLDDKEAEELIASRIGTGRVDAETTAVREIAAACARLPLALAVVSARIAATPSLSLADIAQDLTEHTDHNLDELSADVPSS
ncbi:MAG TPA: BTAD domain-containing putative transcriptional regulator, partial [Jatrophihabitantaceae bacterium]|nr:BTAD domain-containing putative transcriptional regulator [Jatrophihabitantaceae bacterium]